MSITFPPLFLLSSVSTSFDSTDKPGAGQEQMNLCSLNIQKQVTLPLQPLAHDYSHNGNKATEEREDWQGPAGSLYTLSAFSGEKLLSGSGVQEMGSPASFSGAAPPQEERPQQASSPQDGANRKQCLHREGLLEKEEAKMNTSGYVQVISGEELSTTFILFPKN